MNLTRRDVLRLAGYVTGSTLFGRLSYRANAESEYVANQDPVITPALHPFGRAIQANIVIRALPSIRAAMVRRLKWNEIISIKGQTISSASPSTYNQIWYWTDDGYVHSAYIQPVENVLNQPVTTIPESGFWGEVTVPFTKAHYTPESPGFAYYYYYSCIFRVTAIQGDKKGALWYRLSEYPSGGLWSHAEHIRRISPEEFTAISPEVPPEMKHTEVDIKNQSVTAYEGDKPVFTARVSTGATFRLSNGSIANFRTIPGNHRVYLKSATQHMTGGTSTDYYDLPGIGWVSYFTSSGIAFHATYWHNDYGWPHSHGCVNMLPEDAKWMFRWITPTVQYNDWQLRTKIPLDGTLVHVA